MASSSSCHVTEIKHDVFISFRGADVRRGLLSHLVKELCRRQIDAYVDKKLKRGDEISSSLVRAIEGSQILLVIFSKDYASSKWCLEELAKIVECMERNNQIVIPVFYNVDPSDVRCQRGDYGAALAKHEEDFKEDMVKVQNWRSALEKTAQLSGFPYPSNFENESDLVDEIVKDVSNKLIKCYPSDSDDPSESNRLVGIDQNIARIKSLLESASREVLMLGIWGMGGIGKTTLARVVFDTLSPQYEGCCFLEHVREQLGNNQLSYLRAKLDSELLEGESSHINGTSKASSSTFLKNRLRRMKVLIVIDDVNTSKQLEHLVGEPNRFGPGSRVIATSRDKHVFTAGGFHRIHEVKELNFEESLKLFCINAFDESQPKMGYEELSKKAVAIAKGVPLSLKVFGSYFHSKESKDTWECALEQFKKYPDEEIQSVLRLSYDGLRVTEKNIFLDIAFFFKDEDKGYVISRLNAWGFHGACGIEVLKDKALITISNDNRIQMHDLIQEMGWEIVRQESTDPGRRSRLRDAKDVYDVLKNSEGTGLVEGMLLDASQIGEVALILDSLKRMPKLRLLKFYSPLLVEVPMQIRYFVPEDLLNLVFKRIPADDMIEEMDWEIESKESGRCSQSWENEDMDDVFKTNKGSNLVDDKKILDSIIKMHSPRSIKLKSAMHVEHPMLPLPIMQDFVNVKGSGLDMPEQFVKLQKLSKLSPDISKLLNYNELDGVLILQSNMCESKQLMPLPNLNIYASAMKELLSFGSEVHIKSLHHLFMNDCSVSKDSLVFPETLNSSLGILSGSESAVQHENIGPKESSALPSEMRRLNFTDTRMELLNSSTGQFSSLECSENVDGLQLETLPNELPVLRSTYYHRLSNCRGPDSGKPKLLVLFDGFRYSERMSFFILREVRGIWSYLWSLRNYPWLLFSPCPGLTSWHSKHLLESLFLDGIYVERLSWGIKHLLQLKMLSLTGCRFLSFIEDLPPSIVDSMFVFVDRIVLNSSTSGSLELEDLNISFQTCLFKLRARELLEQGYKSKIKDRFRRFRACFLGSKVPEWFAYCTWGDSVSIELVPPPSNLVPPPSNVDFSFLVCLVLTPSIYPLSLQVRCQSYREDGNMTIHGTEKRVFLHEFWENLYSDHVCMWYLDGDLLKKIKKGILNDRCTSSSYDPKVTLQFSFKVKPFCNMPQHELDCSIKECGICPIYHNFATAKRHMDVFYL